MTDTTKSILKAQAMVFAESFIKTELHNYLIGNKGVVELESLTNRTIDKFEQAMITSMNTCTSLNLIKSIEEPEVV